MLIFQLFEVYNQLDLPSAVLQIMIIWCLCLMWSMVHLTNQGQLHGQCDGAGLRPPSPHLLGHLEEGEEGAEGEAVSLLPVLLLVLPIEPPSLPIPLRIKVRADSFEAVVT